MRKPGTSLFLLGDAVMGILTGGTRAGSLPRGFLGLLNILPAVGKERWPLEKGRGDPLGPWAGPGEEVRGAPHPQLPERGRDRKHENEGYLCMGHTRPSAGFLIVKEP